MKRLLLCAAVAAQALVGGVVPSAALDAPVSRAVSYSPDAPGVAAHLGVSVAEAQRRIDLQDDAGRLEALAQRTWPETFAGLWIDHADGASVNVAFTRDAGKNVAVLKEAFAYPASLRARTAARSLRSMTALLDRMVAEREVAKAGRLAFAGVAGGTYDMDVDVVANHVTVTAPAATDDTWSAFAARYGEAVVVQRGPVSRFRACDSTDCRYSLRSGLRVDNPSGLGCTTAFTVTDSVGTRFVLSAAHCNGSTNSDLNTFRKHGNSQFGSLMQQQAEGKVDAERISVNLPTYNFYPGAWIRVSASEEARHIVTWGTYSTMPIGMSVCKSGINTGYTCGTVQSKTHAPQTITNGNSFIKTNMCTGGGDSGSGVYMNGEAEGIVSGDAGVSCSTTGYYSFFGHIEHALVALQVFNMPSGSSEPSPQIQAAEGAKNLTKTVTAVLSKPVRCSTVGASDFTATVNSLSTTVTAASCQVMNDSFRKVTVTLGSTLTAGQTVNLTINSGMTDGGGKASASSSASTVVTL